MNFTFNPSQTRKLAKKALFNAILSVAGLTAGAQNTTPGKIHIGIVYPLSTNGTHAPLDTNNISIHLIAGVSAAEQRVALAGITTIVRNSAKGIQLSGFSNHIGKEAYGAQFAGFMNTYGTGEGFAFAGFTNIAKGQVNGGQFAGFANIAKDVNGIQIGGFLNKSAELNGPQVAGFINIAKNVSSTQIAGFINIAKKVKGAQVAGFINVADSSDFPIGIINLVKNGEKSISLTTDENLTTMATFRSGGKILYGLIGLGYNFRNADEVYAFELGLGAHLFQSKGFRLNTELVTSALESFKKGEYYKSSIRVLPALRISPSLEIFAGPSLNFINTDTEEGRSLTKKYIASWDNKGDNNLNAIYLGYGGGIQFIF